MKSIFWMLKLLQYADFKGRASHRQFWMFVLYNVIAAVIVGLSAVSSSELNAILSGLYGRLALLIPSLAISVRRLQDIDKEWYWILISLIPLVGSIWLIVLYCQPARRRTTGSEKYRRRIRVEEPKKQAGAFEWDAPVFAA